MDKTVSLATQFSSARFNPPIVLIDDADADENCFDNDNDGRSILQDGEYTRDIGDITGCQLLTRGTRRPQSTLLATCFITYFVVFDA